MAEIDRTPQFVLAHWAYQSGAGDTRGVGPQEVAVDVLLALAVAGYDVVPHAAAVAEGAEDRGQTDG